VTLLLNGVPVGTKTSADAQEGILSWKLPFSKGVLKAVAKRGGQEICEFELQTAGVPYRIVLHADVTQLAANGQDVAQIEYDVVDGAGVRIPDAESEISVELSGPARILGIGNGDVANSEPVTAPSHRAFQGRGLVIIQSTEDKGAISLKASAASLEPATITLASR
jgi:beta-galactosidase